MGRVERARPKLLKVDAEMQRWCAQLGEELCAWPLVTTKPMFGMTAYYRGPHIFAALPRTRAPETPFSMLIKLPDTAHAKLRHGHGPGAQWRTFTMDSDADLAEAVKWLGRAYACAADRRKRRR